MEQEKTLVRFKIYYRVYAERSWWDIFNCKDPDIIKGFCFKKEVNVPTDLCYTNNKIILDRRIFSLKYNAGEECWEGGFSDNDTEEKDYDVAEEYWESLQQFGEWTR